MTLFTFLVTTIATAKKNNWRIGQALFNDLYEIRPDISEVLRATPNDPFFSDDVNDPRFVRAVEIITEMWYRY